MTRRTSNRTLPRRRFRTGYRKGREIKVGHMGTRSCYDPGQWEFVRACADRQRQLGRLLTAREILDIAHSLGYRKVAE